LPDDGLFRPELVANIWNNKNRKIVMSDGVHILFHFNIVKYGVHCVCMFVCYRNVVLKRRH
jgi:hypothetical protein